MSEIKEKLAELERRRCEARTYRNAIPYWPAIVLCNLSVFSLYFNTGVGTVFFGMMTGWQLARIWTQVKASKLTPKNEEIEAVMTLDKPLS